MYTPARTASYVLLTLGCADLVALNVLLAPRLSARAAPCPPPVVVMEAAPAPKPLPPSVPVSPPPAAPAPAPRETPPAPVQAASDIIFDFGVRRYTSPSAVADLRRVAAEMKRDGAKKLVVRGHADRLGLPAYNLALSRQRAELVVAILVEVGAPAERITLEAVGDAEPVDRSENPKALAKNRRVELLWR